MDKTGKIVLKSKSICDYIYLHGNVASMGNDYINLFTGEKICNSYQTLSIPNFIFAEDNDQVFKINETTCEVEIFGKPKVSPKTSDIQICNDSPVTVKEVFPAVLKQCRNDKCSCGSKKKFKDCCGKGKF